MSIQIPLNDKKEVLEFSDANFAEVLLKAKELRKQGYTVEMKKIAK